MDFTLTEEQLAWQDRARKFADEVVRPVSLAREQIADPRETFDWEVIRKGSRLGFRTLAVPTEWGGHGADFVTQAVVMAELARADSAIAKTFTQCWKWSHLIAASCTKDQKERFLKPFLADDTYLLGSGTTEPNAGSDNRYPPEDDPRAGWRLKAERHGDEWILNGEKCFIANGSVGKLFFVNTRTNPNVPIKDGTTVFMVPIDTPGFRVGKVFNKAGWRFYQNAELIFENARVPHANMLGAVNEGVKARTGTASEFNDFELACNALGVCMRACETALLHAHTRCEGGRPIFEQQVIQLKLGRMHMLTEALRSFVMRCACEMNQAVHGMPTIVFLMNYSTDVIQQVTALNLELHGGSGGRINALSDKLYRDSLIWSHLAGDSSQRLKALRRFPK